MLHNTCSGKTSKLRMGAREEMHSNLLHWRVPPSTTALLALGWATYFPWDSWEVFWKLWSSEVSIRIFSLSRAYTEQEIAAYLQKQIMKDSKLSATVTVPTVTESVHCFMLSTG